MWLYVKKNKKGVKNKILPFIEIWHIFAHLVIKFVGYES